MPHLQKLYDRIKDRTDIQLVTFNVDDNVGDVAPFMQQNNYTFPVAPASLVVHDLVPSLGIPLNWIVDAEGVVRWERAGFDYDADKWEDQTLEALEKAVKGKG